MESCTVVLSFESVNETSSAVMSHGTIYLVSSSDFWVCGWNLVMLPFKWNLFSSTVTWCFFILYVALTFKSVDEILYCYHSNETSSAGLSHGTICFSAHYKKDIGKFSRIFTLATSGIKRNTKRAPLLRAHFFSHQMSPFPRNLTVE